MNAMGLDEDREREVIPMPTNPSTPGTTSSTPPSTSQSSRSSDTPRKMSSSNGTAETRQDRRKEQVGVEIKHLREELCIHCFFSSFFPDFKDDVYRERINSLPLLTERRFNLTSPAATSRSRRVTWPVVSDEKVYYPVLTDLLNEIVGHFSGTPDPNNNKNVQFIAYDKQMAPITPASLKPDLLLVEEGFSQLSPLEWKHPIITLEVKDHFWEALKQLGTYAREMFSVRPGRKFCWGLYFDHTKSTFRVILFTPDRVYYTRPSVITSEAGYREMAKIIAALISQPDLPTTGEDSSRDSSTKLLPNGDRMEIRAIEFDRKSIVERRTRILSVIVVGKDGRDVSPKISEYPKPLASVRPSGRPRNPSFSLNRLVFTTSVPTQAPTSPSSGAVPPSSIRRYPTRSITSSNRDTGGHHDSEIASSGQPTLQESISDLGAVDYLLKEIRENPDEVITFAENRGHLEIGEHLVIKESWPLASREDVEWSALKSCAKEFGVPEVVYKVTGKHPMSVACTQEPRVPRHIALREKGLRLVEAGSPRILLTAVVHAIIGHWNLFQRGWLHRDVSIGNVLMLTEPVTKSPPAGLGCLGDLTQCRGLLIDGDAMIRSDSARELGSGRSCTPPFLSRRLLKAWTRGTKTFDQHFDDLESFAWVLLWALIEIAEAKKGATAYDRELMKYLNGDNLESLRGGKEIIVDGLKDLSESITQGRPEVDDTSLSKPFIDVLDCWLRLVKTMQHCGKAETLPSSEESTALYKAFITFAMNKMDELPEAWSF